MSKSMDLIERIAAAFDARPRPSGVLAMPVVDDEVPDGHPGVGLGDPIPGNVTDFVLRRIEGRSWRAVDPKDLEWSVHYLSVEAFCYYLPAVLIHNLRSDHDIETIEIHLQGTPGMLDRRAAVRSALSVDERLAVADYLATARGVYGDDDVRYWRDDDGSGERG